MVTWLLLTLLACGGEDSASVPEETGSTTDTTDSETTGTTDSETTGTETTDTESTDTLEVGLYHRETAEACEQEREPAEPASASCNEITGSTCYEHEECVDGLNGRCSFGMELCTCTYDECFVDVDCRGTRLCACGETPPYESRLSNHCLPAECKTDDDCASGLCLANRAGCSSSDLRVWGFYCGTEADTCRSDSVCTGSERCIYTGEAFTCSIGWQITCE